jgi:hypothetical protein
MKEMATARRAVTGQSRGEEPIHYTQGADQDGLRDPPGPRAGAGAGARGGWVGGGEEVGTGQTGATAACTDDNGDGW